MGRRFALGLLSTLLLAATDGRAEVVLTGRVLHPRYSGTEETVPLTAILALANVAGSESEPLSFRTWETEPAGWFRMSGGAGNYTLVFANPAHFLRPLLVTNVYLRPGQQWKQNVAPTLDAFSFDQRQWDDQPAGDYYQLFAARGRSLTQVGFKLAHDGVDGAGPGSQDLRVSIRRRGPGTPDAWQQVGPAALVVGVDSGGPKDYLWSAGWNSGEVPLQPGETYAVHLRAEQAEGQFQAFWRPCDCPATDCYRLGRQGVTGYRGRQLWFAVASDGDGLLIPYNKRVHKQFVQLTSCLPKWSQTYVAQGRGLAAVILYAAVSGAQPPLSRQRVVVRIRRGGPKGPQVGIEKIAVGNGNYTGDASWGVFGAVFAPGEVPLEPGTTYAVEFESIENYATLHGFVNIKGEVSNDRPGFNPYRKHPRHGYEPGTAYRLGAEAVDFDLDAQIVEYESAAEHWATAVHAENLLRNGDMQAGDFRADEPAAGRIDAWEQFTLDPGTSLAYASDGAQPANRVARVLSGLAAAKTADGGYVQRVSGLSAAETYRLSGQVRASWPIDETHQTYVGYDPTGQVEDPLAKTIVWTTLPSRHGVFVPCRSEPIRPVRDSVSVWLRGRATAAAAWRYQADFDDFALRRVRTGVPTATLLPREKASDNLIRTGAEGRDSPENGGGRNEKASSE
jgi:hypothetical protein